MVREGRPSWEVWLLDSKVTPRRFTRVFVWPQFRSQCFLAKAFSKIVLCAWTFPSFERVRCWPIDFSNSVWWGVESMCVVHGGAWRACVPCCAWWGVESLCAVLCDGAWKACVLCMMGHGERVCHGVPPFILLLVLRQGFTGCSGQS